MARTIHGGGAAFDVRPVGETAYGGPISTLIGFIMDAVRGACAGLLMLLGGAHVMGGIGEKTPAATQGWDAFAAIAQHFSMNGSMNGFAGAADLIGGAALFLTARRAVARTIGVLAFIALLAAYAQGYTLADVVSAAWRLLGEAAGAVGEATTGEATAGAMETRGA